MLVFCNLLDNTDYRGTLLEIANYLHLKVCPGPRTLLRNAHQSQLNVRARAPCWCTLLRLGRFAVASSSVRCVFRMLLIHEMGVGLPVVRTGGT